jgi:hypothetical protein
MSKWQIPSAEKEMYALMNWTGYALRLYPFEIDMTFRKDPEMGEVVPAMPLEPLVVSATRARKDEAIRI